jgi:hypothetical protein
VALRHPILGLKMGIQGCSRSKKFYLTVQYQSLALVRPRMAAGEARLAEVFRKAGFSHFRRAAETPFNLILEVRR